MIGLFKEQKCHNELNSSNNNNNDVHHSPAEIEGDISWRHQNEKVAHLYHKHVDTIVVRASLVNDVEVCNSHLNNGLIHTHSKTLDKHGPIDLNDGLHPRLRGFTDDN